jgi:hypothetical protein
MDGEVCEKVGVGSEHNTYLTIERSMQTQSRIPSHYHISTLLLKEHKIKSSS